MKERIFVHVYANKLMKNINSFCPLTSTCQAGRIRDAASQDTCQVSPLLYCVIDWINT